MAFKEPEIVRLMGLPGTAQKELWNRVRWVFSTGSLCRAEGGFRTVRHSQGQVKHAESGRLNSVLGKRCGSSPKILPPILPKTTQLGATEDLAD